MDKKSLSEIQTLFWCQSILDTLDLGSVAEFKKLPNLPFEPFKKNYSHLFTNKDELTKAYEVFCIEPLDPKTWLGYFNGTSPTKKTKGKRSSYDIIGELIPQTQQAYCNGCFNIINVFTSSYIRDAIRAFANAVTELYKSKHLDIGVWQSNLDTRKPELVTNYRVIFDSNLARGNFKFCFDYYVEILNQRSDELGQNISILKLIEAYINLNYFGETPKVFSRLLVEGEAVRLMKEQYNIKPFLWKKTFQVVSDALLHYEEHKDELFWIEEKEKFIGE